ncbi:hypothetical protein UREG_05196 [Uncinocarpus reesii 1704]|uniref:Probable quinone oxidoreductase n=1 Tax=Uncinocarpus reesii (strain UAMH 1704) TaxID=336963 RepID=C4JRV7_UNCRE|nr:uncharacterized protein UREG_05196 [Uncinocarpus reesii 1704]EEP80354.1 hypothetical protein UREG_05196 [Uncinocarpus reesii 1704]
MSFGGRIGSKETRRVKDKTTKKKQNDQRRGSEREASNRGFNHAISNGDFFRELFEHCIQEGFDAHRHWISHRARVPFPGQCNEISQCSQAQLQLSLPHGRRVGDLAARKHNSDLCFKCQIGQQLLASRIRLSWDSQQKKTPGQFQRPLENAPRNRLDIVRGKFQKHLALVKTGEALAIASPTGEQGNGAPRVDSARCNEFVPSLALRFARWRSLAGGRLGRTRNKGICLQFGCCFKTALSGAAMDWTAQARRRRHVGCVSPRETSESEAACSDDPVRRDALLASCPTSFGPLQRGLTSSSSRGRQMSYHESRSVFGGSISFPPKVVDAARIFGLCCRESTFVRLSLNRRRGQSIFEDRNHPRDFARNPSPPMNDAALVLNCPSNILGTQDTGFAQRPKSRARWVAGMGLTDIEAHGAVFLPSKGFEGACDPRMSAPKAPKTSAQQARSRSSVRDDLGQGLAADAYKFKARNAADLLPIRHLSYRAGPALRVHNPLRSLSSPRPLFPIQILSQTAKHQSTMAATTVPTVQKAIQISRTGGPEVLEYQTSLPVPTPGPGEVLIKNSLSGVNYIDTYFRTGLYPSPKPEILGREGAGTIVALGSGPSPQRFKIGDRVAWLHTGGYAEYSVAPAEKRVVKIPDGVSDEQALAVLLSGITTLSLVKEAYPVQKGDWILLHAAAGGAGYIMTQMLKDIGAKVIGTAGGPEKVELVKSLGADVVIDYKSPEGANWLEKVMEVTGGEGVAAVFDSVGKDTWENSIKAVKRKGTMVFFGNASGPVPPLNIQLLSAKNIKMLRTTLFNYIATQEEFDYYTTELFDMVKSGKLKTRVHKVYPLEQAAQAHIDLEGRKTTGKLLLKP